LDEGFVATAMVACTLVAAPIMFVSAKLLSLQNVDPSDYIGELDTFLLDVSVLSKVLKNEIFNILSLLKVYFTLL